MAETEKRLGPARMVIPSGLLFFQTRELSYTVELMAEKVLIDADDFKSFQLRISLTNEDTGVEVREGKRYFRSSSGSRENRGEAAPVEIFEFLDGEITVETPSDSALKGHRVRLEIETVNVPEPDRFTLTGKVRKVEQPALLAYEYGQDERKVKDVLKIEVPREALTITLDGDQTETLQRLRSLYSGRQNQILEFFKAAKGI